MRTKLILSSCVLCFAAVATFDAVAGGNEVKPMKLPDVAISNANCGDGQGRGAPCSTKAPEIDAGSGARAIVLLIGGLLVVGEGARRRAVRRAQTDAG